ncbi:MAG: YhjD/YihY/BrkB family envelope integrity protein [Candidatus Paceibacterota bacterium]
MKYIQMFYQAIEEWIRNDMGYYSAAFSYYAPLALIPLVLLSIAVSGFFYGSLFVKSIFLSWGTILGDDLLALINVAVQNLDLESQTYSIPILAIVFFSSMSLFALNVPGVGFSRLWKIESSGLVSFISRTWRSITFIFILQIYFFVIIGLNGLVTYFSFPFGNLISEIILFLSIPLIFFLLFRFLVKNVLSLQGAIVGSMVSGVLFMFAKGLVALYLAANPVLSIFGATGLTLVLLVWVYVLAAIIYFGAAVAHVYDRMNVITVR